MKQIPSENGRLAVLWMHWITHVHAWEVRYCGDNFVAIWRLIRQWIGPFVLHGDRVSCSSSVRASRSSGLGSRMTWLKVADDAPTVSLFTVWSTAFLVDWKFWATWPEAANPVCARWAVMKALTPYAYESIPKNCLCHTTRKKVG